MRLTDIGRFVALHIVDVVYAFLDLLLLRVVVFVTGCQHQCSQTGKYTISNRFHIHSFLLDDYFLTIQDIDAALGGFGDASALQVIIGPVAITCNNRGYVFNCIPINVIDV